MRHQTAIRVADFYKYKKGWGYKSHKHYFCNSTSIDESSASGCSGSCPPPLYRWNSPSNLTGGKYIYNKNALLFLLTFRSPYPVAGQPSNYVLLLPMNDQCHDIEKNIETVSCQSASIKRTDNRTDVSHKGWCILSLFQSLRHVIYVCPDRVDRSQFYLYF